MGCYTIYKTSSRGNSHSCLAGVICRGYSGELVSSIRPTKLNEIAILFSRCGFLCGVLLVHSDRRPSLSFS